MVIRTAVVPVAEIFELRHQVLRPGMPRQAAVFAEDAHPGAFHIVAYGDDAAGAAAEVLGCGSFYPEALPGTAGAPGGAGTDGGAAAGAEAAPVYRIRGMASDPRVRGRGFGAAVLEAGTAEALRRGAELLWCNGRTEARGFYERYGYAVRGEEFVIDGVGPHFLFARHLEPQP